MRRLGTRFLEGVLPGLLFIKMTSLVDDALELTIAASNIPLPPNFRDRLFDRIELLKAAGRLSAPDDLHRIRRRRNDLAHQAEARATWDELDRELATLHRELAHLGLVGDKPEYEAFAERSAMRASDDPSVLAECTHTFGLRHGGKVVVEYSSTERLHRSST